MLNKKLLQDLLIKMSDSLTGDWLIFGGTVPYLLGMDVRPTVDIDLASFSISTNQDSLLLMNLVQEFGLPLETINQAGGFFLQKIPGWQEQVILLKAGKKSRIYRPNLELYLRLKSARMTEADVQDCLSYLDFAYRNNEIKNLNLIVKNLEKACKDSQNAKATARIQQVISELKKY